MNQNRKRGILVLVMEDDTGIRNLVCEIVQSSQLGCVGVKNGSEALEFINKNKSNNFLIFVDLMMPGMNGWEFLKQVKELRNTIRMKLIVITGLNPSKWATAIEDSDRILEKPFRVEDILNIVEEFEKEINLAA